MDNGVLRGTSSGLVGEIMKMTRWKSLLVVGFCASCGGTAGDVGGPAPGPAPEFRVTADPSLVELTDSEWVVEYSDAPPPYVACPDDGEWKGELLHEANPHLAAAANMPDHFRRYCRYTWNGTVSPGDEPDPAAVTWGGTSSAGVVAKNPVTIGVAPQGLLRDTLGEKLLARFQWRYQNFGPGSQFENTAAARSAVTLAVVDTKPNDPGVPGRSAHGLHMIELAKPIVCPPDSTGCTVDIVPSLGLPRIANGAADWDNGGHYADASDVGLGILAAVSRWQAAPSSRLVINLSVGIDLEIFAPNGAGIEASRNILRDAIAYARCYGTVVAAAGNDVDMGTQGALYPALLEADMMPSAAECTGFGVQQVPPVGATQYRPLVHAIGGLNDSIGAAPNTRTGSIPPLVAPATSTTYLTGNPNEPFGPVTTGTSNASIVAAASAALMLSFDPQLGRAGVMQHLHDEGGGTILSADLYYSGVSQVPPVRRLMLCDALDALCGGGGCGPLVLDCDIGGIPFNDEDIAAELAGLDPAPVETEITFGESEWCPNLGRDVVFGEEQTPDCSLSDYEPMERITTPQPDEPVCDFCPWITTESALMIEIDDAYEETIAQYGVSRAVATFKDASGTPIDFILESPSVSTTEPMENTLPDEERVPDEISSATLTVYFGSGMVRRGTIDVVDPVSF